MIADEPVRGSLPPPWFLALPGIDRIRALSLSRLPLPPLSRLLGIRPAHVGPGSGTWTMPASAWLERVTGTLETSMLAEAALTGAAITTLPPGMDADPLILEINYFRPARPQSGNLLAHARVINASRFFIFTQVDIEDPEGRQIGHGTSHCRIRSVEPSPPAPPATLPPVEESTYPTPDPYLRPATRGVVPPEVWEENSGLAVVQLIAEGRFPNPYAKIMGRELQAVDEGRVVTSTSCQRVALPVLPVGGCGPHCVRWRMVLVWPLV